jgi:hypothetical protein
MHRESILDKYHSYLAGCRQWAFWRFEGPAELRRAADLDEQIDGDWLNNIRAEDARCASR